MTEKPYTSAVMYAYAYDHQGRMVSKEVSGPTSNQQLETRNYLWDNWNIIRETVTDHPSLTTNHTYYVWGIDLSGTLQGAGGVGGLLAVIKDDNIYAPTYDANGNVSEYVSLADGIIAAHYEYDPFGNIVVQAGDLADSFTFRFSTKPYCPITGIVHYQLRPYSPPLGRFLPRDPIEEMGGLNLYGFVGNDPVNKTDRLGLERNAPPQSLNGCCIDGKVYLDEPIDTGVAQYWAWRGKVHAPVSYQHSWIEYPGGSIGFWPGDGHYPGTIQSPDQYAVWRKNGGLENVTSEPVKLSPCEYDIEKFVSCFAKQDGGGSYIAWYWLFNCSDCAKRVMIPGCMEYAKRQ